MKPRRLEKLQLEMASQQSAFKLEMIAFEEELSSERKFLGECRIRLVEMAGACKYALLQMVELRGVSDEISAFVQDMQCTLAASHDGHIQRAEKNERDIADSMNRCLTASGELCLSLIKREIWPNDRIANCHEGNVI